MRKIRLAVLVSTLTIGGAEQLLLELLRNMDRERFDFRFYFLDEPGILGEELLALGYPAEMKMLRSRFDLAGTLRLARSFSSNEVDALLLINHRNTLFYGVLAARRAGVPVIVNWENETFKSYSWHAATMLLRRVLHLWIDKVVAASMGHGEYIKRVEGIPGRKVVTIYNGVDRRRFTSSLSASEAKSRLGIPGESPVVSIIAVLRPDKAHEVFLKAAVEVLSVFPQVHFLIIGDGPRRKALEAASVHLGLEGKVHFLGFRRDLADILAAVDVNVLSSFPLQETLSVAVIEAMSVGIPIVCTDVGFMSEVVIPGKTGYLTAVGDSRDLASRLVTLLGNRELRSSLGEEARRLVQDRFSVHKMARSFEDLFQGLLAGKPSWIGLCGSQEGCTLEGRETRACCRPEEIPRT